jgi:hypothetical protein
MLGLKPETRTIWVIRQNYRSVVFRLRHDFIPFANHSLQHLYKARDKLHIRFCRRDPIQLPAEIVQWVLSYCDLATRVYVIP